MSKDRAMSELSVRETAARAAGAVLWNVSNYPERAQAAMLGQDTGPLRDKVADAVLAAVADHDGLADVLRTHHHNYDSDCGRDFGCSCGAIDDYDESDTDHAAHLADVVRAWLRGTT